MGRQLINKESESKEMKKILVSVVIMVLFIGLLIPHVSAEETTKNIIKLSDDQITINGNEISTDKNESVYKTNIMDNGGTSDESKSENKEIDNIININAPGVYEFSGSLSDGQISVNANNIKGNVEIILNNIDITCEEAPAIFIYSQDTESEDCKVTITLADGSQNTVSGGKLKINVEGFDDQESILYYIEKDYDDDGSYYERCKYDGVISSDISLIFEGEGTLNVNSLEKEGIESKMHITINGGTYIIKSLDDGINASSTGKSVITINDGLVVVDLQDEAEEGDGIDSNGEIYINGGTVYAFSHSGSDNGLDSDGGTYINGGNVFSTGSMYEETVTENDTTIVQMQFSSNVNEGESIVIVDESNTPVFAYKADREISTIVYTSENLEKLEYGVYTGTSIDGIVGEYDIYSDIKSVDLENMTKQENTGKAMEKRMDMRLKMEKVGYTEKNTELAIIGGVLIGIGVIIAIVAIIGLRRKND